LFRVQYYIMNRISFSLNQNITYMYLHLSLSDYNANYTIYNSMEIDLIILIYIFDKILFPIILLETIEFDIHTIF